MLGTNAHNVERYDEEETIDEDLEEERELKRLVRSDEEYDEEYVDEGEQELEDPFDCTEENLIEDEPISQPPLQEDLFMRSFEEEWRSAPESYPDIVGP